jgi:hypothetical protein
MGHIRLGKIPKSKKWSAVVESVSKTGDTSTLPADDLVANVQDVAKQTLIAAEGGLQTALNDTGLQYSFFLLTQIALAARTNDWRQRLEQFGIYLSPDASFQDLTVEMQAAIDDFVFSHGRSTDVGEIAQQAACEAITDLTAQKAVTLFGSGAEELQIAVRDLSTKKGFSTLGQKFFGVFMARYLNFYLSRVTAANIGNKYLPQIGDINRFDDALRLHCEQSARIVRDFCGEWFSKTEFKEGIDLDNTARFIAVAVKKLQAELRQQGDEE